MTPFFAQFEPPSLGEQVLYTLIVSAIWGALMFYKLFEKAGKPGWAGIVPIYQWIVLAEVARKPIWWGLAAALATWIPFVGWIISIVFMVLLAIEVCKLFGKPGAGMVILCLICGIGYMIMGFGDAQYEGAGGHD